MFENIKPRMQFILELTCLQKCVGEEHIKAIGARFSAPARVKPTYNLFWLRKNEQRLMITGAIYWCQQLNLHQTALIYVT